MQPQVCWDMLSMPLLHLTRRFGTAVQAPTVQDCKSQGLVVCSVVVLLAVECFFQPLANLEGLDTGQQDVMKDVDAAFRHLHTIRRRSTPQFSI